MWGLLSLIPLPWRIGIGLGVLVALGWGARLWLNARDEQMMFKGRQVQIAAEEKALKPKWEAVQKAVVIANQALTAERAVRAAVSVQLAEARAVLRTALAKKGKEVQVVHDIIEVEVARIPDDKLADAIRVELDFVVRGLESLNEDESRAALGAIRELKACNALVAFYLDYIAKDEAQDLLEKADFENGIRIEHEAVILMTKERDQALERAQFYESAYKTVTRKRSVGCWFKKIFSLGLIKCS